MRRPRSRLALITASRRTLMTPFRIGRPRPPIEKKVNWHVELARIAPAFFVEAPPTSPGLVRALGVKRWNKGQMAPLVIFVNRCTKAWAERRISLTRRFWATGRGFWDGEP